MVRFDFGCFLRAMCPFRGRIALIFFYSGNFLNLVCGTGVSEAGLGFENMGVKAGDALKVWRFDTGEFYVFLKILMDGVNRY